MNVCCTTYVSRTPLVSVLKIFDIYSPGKSKHTMHNMRKTVFYDCKPRVVACQCDFLIVIHDSPTGIDGIKQNLYAVIFTLNWY